MSHDRLIATTTHGRYLLDAAPGHPTRPLLVGFHGYGEAASIQLERLRGVRGTESWDIVAVQALHRFYGRGGERTVASWMTREDRDVLIQDNVAYVDRVLEAVTQELGSAPTLAFLGFSQGASMAYRAAALCERRCWGVVAAGGDVPPELSDEQLARIPRVLIAHGERDPWFTTERCQADADRLRRCGVETEVLELDTAHDWTDVLTTHAAAWLHAMQ